MSNLCQGSLHLSDAWLACEACGRQFYLRNDEKPELVVTPNKCSPSHRPLGVPSLRQMYRAGKDKILVHADYSQIELRVMAEVANDTKLRANLVIGDVYTEDAKDWFGLPTHYTKKDVKPAARKACKIIHLGSQYGATIPTVYRIALREDSTMQYGLVAKNHAGFQKTYKDTVSYWAREYEDVLTKGYSESRILGRRQVYPKRPELPECVNYPIQATASDVVNLAMLRLREALKQVPGAKLITQLHDAFDVECWQKDEQLVAGLMKSVMEEPVEICGKMCVFPVEIKSAIFWSDC